MTTDARLSRLRFGIRRLLRDLPTIVAAGASGLALGAHWFGTGVVLMMTAAVLSTLPGYRDLWRQRGARTKA
jgi:hypothetical protein